ncbi:MAG: inositol monophosphatase family protein [Hyphomicrobiales bacterium]
MFLDIITKQVCGVCRGVGMFIRQESGRISKDDVEEKGVHDLVTYVDKTSEKRLKQELSSILPEAGFIAEESPNSKRADRYNWIIDPLDGTTNFIHGIPVFAISIALMDGDEVILGVVYEVIRDECFYAWKDSKAYLNGKAINVTPTTNIDNALFATGFPYTDFSKLSNYLEFFADLLVKSRGIRRLGSAATDLAYVACGRFDGFYEYGLSPWDVAAGSIIVKQAGGIVSDFSKQNNYIFGREIIATNEKLNNTFTSMIQQYFL